MRYTEREVWRMTYRKLDLLFKEYCKFNGIEFKTNPDEVVPGEEVV